MIKCSGSSQHGHNLRHYLTYRKLNHSKMGKLLADTLNQNPKSRIWQVWIQKVTLGTILLMLLINLLCLTFDTLVVAIPDT